MRKGKSKEAVLRHFFSLIQEVHNGKRLGDGEVGAILRMYQKGTIGEAEALTLLKALLERNGRGES